MTSTTKPPPPLFSRRSYRLRVALMLMFGLWTTWSMRLNLNMAVTCMVNSSVVEHHDDNLTLNVIQSRILRGERKCVPVDHIEAKQRGYAGHLEWTPSMQSLLFSATFYTGFITIMISGYVADRFGPKTMLLVASLDFVMISFLSPWLAEASYWAFFSSRLIMGLAEGFIFPSLNSMVSKWFPPTEKSSVAAIYTSGIQLASGLSSLISAFLCTTSLGWPAIFYLFGITGCIWCVLCFVFTTNTPAENKFISVEEEKFLEETCANKSNRAHFKNNRLPWKSILCDKEVFACYFCNLSCNFMSNVLQSFLPTYLKEELMLPIQLNGLFTAVPFCCQLFSKNSMGPFSDYLKRSKGINPTTTVVVFQAISSFGSAAALVLLGIFPSCENYLIALPILIFYGLCFSCLVPGYFTSLLSIAGPYTGTVSSVSSIYGTIGNLGGPLLLSFINYMGFANKWAIIFCATAAFQFAGGVIFVLWGSADVVPWARGQSDKTESTSERSS